MIRGPQQVSAQRASDVRIPHDVVGASGDDQSIQSAEQPRTIICGNSMMISRNKNLPAPFLSMQ
jgi:hypothetical protein